MTAFRVQKLFLFPSHCWVISHACEVYLKGPQSCLPRTRLYPGPRSQTLDHNSRTTLSETHFKLIFR
uniref:Putative secreted peptide n=1 Tax=Anopheles braziliensis TaxID=58242 RepID=A0A2M3ZRE6_9DIPT